MVQRILVVLGLVCLRTICITSDVILYLPDPLLLLMAAGIFALAAGLVSGTAAQGKWLATFDAQKRFELVRRVNSEIDNLKTKLNSRIAR
jgi:hypothetical protein